MLQKLLQLGQKYRTKLPHPDALSLENYDGSHFHFHVSGSGRHEVLMTLEELCAEPELLSELSPEDNGYIGLIVGELYQQAVQDHKSVVFPLHTLTDSGGHYVLCHYDDASKTVIFMDNTSLKRHNMPLFALVQNVSLMRQFNRTHAYQLGFHAGEEIFRMKHSLQQLPSSVPRPDNLMPWPN